MKRTSRVAVVLLALVLGAAPAFPDVLKLADGRVLEGRIVQESDTEVKLEMSRGGAITVPRKDVVEIVRQKSNTEVLEERLRALSPDRPADYLELGKWCLEEMRREDLGIRLISTAMALDPKHYLPCQMALGDYWSGKSDKGRAAPHYLRAVLAAPEDPECTKRFDSVKDGVQNLDRESDRTLLGALQAIKENRWADASEAIGRSRSSAVRADVESLLGLKLEAVTAICSAKQGCRTCKGALRITCPDCKGKGSSPCKTCGGDGRLKRTSAQGTTTTTCGTCGGRGKFTCKRCVTATTGTFRGIGTIACPTCKGVAVSASQTSGLSTFAVDSAIAFLQRRAEGVLTLAEQAKTRMLRVGAANDVEDADDLIANPYWLGDRWGPAPSGGGRGPDAEPSGAETDEVRSLRESAEKLQPEAGGFAPFLARLRGIFGIGPASGAVAQRVFVSEFRLRPPADPAAAPPPEGAWCEFDPRDLVLRPVLAQVSESYAERRVDLTDATGAGLALRRDPALAAAAGSPEARVLVWYRVVEVREDVVPQADRDRIVLRLMVKPALVDVLDRTGKVLLTVK